MGVYIRGMEMPKSCRECKLVEGNYYCPFTGVSWMQRGEEYYNKKHPDCPVNEVKQHGRLIDADALKWNYIRIRDDGIKEFSQYGIDRAPTIIPAEPCNDLAKPNIGADYPPSVPLKQVWTELFGEDSEA